MKVFRKYQDKKIQRKDLPSSVINYLSNTTVVMLFAPIVIFL
jgi:hypothetical protein